MTTNNKEVLKKLFKIAENQQKIIRKLAQDVAAVPATSPATPMQTLISLNLGVLQNVVDSLLGKGKVQLLSASLSNEGGKLLSSLKAADKDTFDRMRTYIEDALKRPNVLVDTEGKRHSASEVSLNEV